MGERWTDDRLDDRFAAIDRTLQRLDKITGSMTEVPGKLEELAADTHECRAGIAGLRAAIQERNEQRARERIASLELREREQRDAKAEKKKDRRWFAGIVLTASGVIVAAVGILLSVVT